MSERITIEDLQGMDPDDFERFVGRAMELEGFFNVLPSGGTGDEGIDLRAEWSVKLPTGDQQHTIWAVQCKRYSNSLNQGDVQKILNAALEPTADLFPVPPDFFLLATSTHLTADATRLIERANHNRAKYGCRFVVWNGDDLARRANTYPDLAEVVVGAPTTPSVSRPPAPAARLALLVDHFEDEVALTFLYDRDGRGPDCLMERVKLSREAFQELVDASRKVGRIGFIGEYSTNAEDAVKELGRRLAHLLPIKICQVLFASQGEYLRITSNWHLLPFELVYDDGASTFLGDQWKIGRVQTTSSSRVAPVHARHPNALVVAATAERIIEDRKIPALPEADKEVEIFADILQQQGFTVTLLRGEAATRKRVAEALASDTFQMIHFVGHGLADDQHKPGLLLAEGIFTFEEFVGTGIAGSIVFLNLCSTGEILNNAASQLFERGATAVVGFIGPVTDPGAGALATTFYTELAQGASLGAAMQKAKARQRMNQPDDQSWASFVLFGDPTRVVMQRDYPS